MQFGGTEQFKELCRDQLRQGWLERCVLTPMHLLRHGFASVRRTPLLALTIVVTLGIALAACVVVFSFLNTCLFRPLPYGDGSRLVSVYEHSIKSGRGNSMALTYDNVVAVEERANVFSRLAIFRLDSATIEYDGAAEAATLGRVNAQMFTLLGARPAIGATITAANAEVGGAPCRRSIPPCTSAVLC
jgi:putative ABC transport system permease protein